MCLKVTNLVESGLFYYLSFLGNLVFNLLSKVNLIMITLTIGIEGDAGTHISL